MADGGGGEVEGEVNRVLDKVLEIISWAWLFRLIYGFGDAISPAGIPALHVRFRDGRFRNVFGSLPKWVRDQVGETLAEHGVSRAVIKQTKDGRFRFSRGVPEGVRQRIRNVIASR